MKYGKQFLFGIILLCHSPVPAGTYAYITNQGADSLSIIDIEQQALIATIPVGHRPAGIAVSHIDSRVYVSNPESKDISVINTKNRSVIKNVPVGEGPVGIALSPDSNYLYIADWYKNALFVLSMIFDCVKNVGAALSGLKNPSW